MLEDKKIRCADCHKDFMFTADQQQFAKKMIEEGQWEGVYREPKRCRSCRDKKKEERKQRLVREASSFKPLYDQIKDGLKAKNYGKTADKRNTGI